MQGIAHYRKNRFQSLDTRNIPKKDSNYFGFQSRFEE